MDRDRERSRDPAFPVRIPALAAQSSKASHSHLHVIQPEKSNYFTTLSNSVVNEPPRLYPSKELSSYYDKVSATSPGIVASVGATVQSHGIQPGNSFGSFSSKVSLSKPPPLIKHKPEGAEGLAGKITEQLSQQVTLVQPQLHTSIDRVERRSPAISPSTSTSSLVSASNHHHHSHHQQQQQHQLRAMPSLHRAPVFHPPMQHALERKEASEREKEWERSGYGGRLSPPTLTPIQPVSLATSGTKISVEQQKPPTLLPELRDIKGHGLTAAVTSVASTISRDMMADGWKGREIIQEREGVYSREKEMLREKPHAAMASVIVRPSMSIKYDNPVGANKSSGAIIHKELPTGRLNPSKPEGECIRFGENAGEPGTGRVIQPNSKLDHMCIRYKNNSMQGIQGPSGPSTANSLCRSGVLVSSATDIQSKTLKSGCSPWDEFAALKTGGGGWVHSKSGPDRNRENHESFDSSTTSHGMALPTSTAGLPLPSPGLAQAPSSISGSNQPYSSSFIHLKKHKAALAAAQSRSNLPTAPTSVTTGNCPSSLDVVDKARSYSSTPPPCSSQASSSSTDSSGSNSATGSSTPGTSSPLPNGQSSGLASSSGQPSNYHKLKKAWLTRHSEEDRNTTTTTSSTAIKTEKVLTTTANTCNTTAMSDMIKPCTVNLSASTSSEVEMSKDCGIKAERERQQEEKTSGASGGVGEERRSAHSSRRGNKRTYESGSESGGDDSDGSESKMEGRAKRQPKPTYKKKQNDMAKRKGDNEKEDDDGKPNGIFRSAREKTKLKLASSSKSFLCSHLNLTNKLILL